MLDQTTWIPVYTFNDAFFYLIVERKILLCVKCLNISICNKASKLDLIIDYIVTQIDLSL